MTACSTELNNEIKRNADKIAFIIIKYFQYNSISGVLVMVSSGLVVLLIVCVGINTGSAQGELL